MGQSGPSRFLSMYFAFSCRRGCSSLQFAGVGPAQQELALGFGACSISHAFSFCFLRQMARENRYPCGGLLTYSFDLRFPGQYYDVETGLNYNSQRDYDPGTGRYVESDPTGLHGGINTYSYAGLSPLMLIDPLGLAIYRGAGNYYSDIPPSGMCDQAVMAGDYVVGWTPCNFGSSTRGGCSSDYDYGHGGWPSAPGTNGAGNDGGSPSNFPPFVVRGVFTDRNGVSFRWHRLHSHGLYRNRWCELVWRMRAGDRRFQLSAVVPGFIEYRQPDRMGLSRERRVRGVRQ
jgi:RHS repeat-associated protein